MRWLFGLCLLLCLGACSLFEPSGQRYAIYFQESCKHFEFLVHHHKSQAIQKFHKDF